MIDQSFLKKKMPGAPKSAQGAAKKGTRCLVFAGGAEI
jgi:hypothetical protein